MNSARAVLDPNKMKLTVTVLLPVLLLGACTTSPNNRAPRQIEPNYGIVHDIDISKKTYEAADALLERSSQGLNKGEPVLVASLVDVNKLERSSPLGRVLAEQLSSRLVQQGYFVSEPKLRGSLAVKRNVGELILSRDLKYIRKAYNAQAVLSGTYAVGSRKVHVNLKLIRAMDGKVLSAVDYALPLGPDTRALVKTT